MKSIELVLDSLGIFKDENLISSLNTYAEEIIKWNRRINLTGASTVEEFIRGPLYDALTILKVMEKKGSLVDVGSGGGLPGVPVALANPGVEITFVEPRKKRASFLGHVVHRLGLDTEVLEVREDKLPSYGWTGAVSQAVWSPDVWLGRAQRLVKPGGAIYVLSSDPIDPSIIPPSITLEREEMCIRPFDRKSRYASLIRVSP